MIYNHLRGGKDVKKFKRIREWMDIPGRFMPGEKNMITDVPGVLVGHHTIHNDEKEIHTGVTIITPHNKDAYHLKTPASMYSGNGFGKSVGGMQIEELGEIESLIGLTNTLSVSQVTQGLLNYHVPSMTTMQTSINITVGETNDAFLSDIKGFHVKPEHVQLAIENLSTDVVEGAVGAGAGTYCFGFKGGIGTSSRVVKADNIGEKEDYCIGALVQSNYGGNLTVYGHALPYKNLSTKEIKGSCMIIVATNAPMSDRQLKRLAKRGLIGLTNTGSYMNHHSGDIVIAFSNYEKNLRSDEVVHSREVVEMSETQMTPFFEAVVFVLNVDPSEVVKFNLVMVLGTSLSAMFVGILSSKYRRKNVSAIGICGLIVCTVLAYIFTDETIFLILMFLIGVFWMCANINITLMAIDTNNDENRIGAFAGANQFAIAGANILGPIAGGFLVEILGNNYRIIWLIMPVFLLMSLFTLLKTMYGEAKVQ